jgi:hypothetical protein
MPARETVPVTLTAAERTTLKKMRVRGAKTPYRDRLWAQIVLAAARGRDNARITADLGISVDTARRHRGAAVAVDRAGTGRRADGPGTGRPDLGDPDPADPGRAPGQAVAVPVLDLTRDPDFEARRPSSWTCTRGFTAVSRYGPGDRILSFDAKPSIQARGRCQPTLPARGTPVRIEHEYVRHGALALLASLDAHIGTVFAATPATTRIKPFMDLAGQVMARPEYTSAPRVFVIVDNGSDHRSHAASDRLRAAHPNAIMIHTPVHASRPNQIEIFSLLSKRKPSPPTTSPAWTSCPPPCLPSLTATTDCPPVQLEVHRQRPPRPAPPHQRARTTRPAPDRTSGGRLTPRRTYGVTH